jgi:hypothetical protein
MPKINLVQIQLAILELSHADGRIDEYGKMNILTLFETFHHKRAKHEHQRGMYLIGQLLSGNLITYWSKIFSIFSAIVTSIDWT